MLFLYVLLLVYILSVNFYAFYLLKMQKENWENGAPPNRGDGKLLLAALLGGAITAYLSMFLMRFRLTNALLMIFLPLIAVLNLYCFYLGFRGIYFLP